MAKAADWAGPDAEARRRGERTGLDTPVVHAVNDADWAWGDLTPSVPEPTREVCRLGSTAARLKLKGIDGGPHKRRSVRFNSTQRAEPYQGLTCACRPRKRGGLRGWRTGAAWLSSARAVRCWVKSRNERNPRVQLNDLDGLPVANRRKVGTTSSQHGPYALGDTHATMAGTAGSQAARRSQSPKPGPSSDRGLQPARVKPESLVTAGQHYRGEYVPGPCTHRPSRHESRQRLKPVGQPFGGAAVEGGAGDWDEVVTR